MTASQAEKSTAPADGSSQNQVVAQFGKQDGVTGQGLVQVNDRRQGLDVDPDRLGRIGCLVRGLGHDHRHRLAHEADPVTGEERPRHLGRVEAHWR